MKCPFCDSEDLKVIDSRETTKGEIRRRRKCIQCGEMFSTYESIGKQIITVVVRNGQREFFNRERLTDSITHATYNTAVTGKDIVDIVTNVESLAIEKSAATISTDDIIQYVSEELKKIDEKAYVKYLVDYKQFICIEDIASTLQNKAGGNK